MRFGFERDRAGFEEVAAMGGGYETAASPGLAGSLLKPGLKRRRPGGHPSTYIEQFRVAERSLTC